MSLFFCECVVFLCVCVCMDICSFRILLIIGLWLLLLILHKILKNKQTRFVKFVITIKAFKLLDYHWIFWYCWWYLWFIYTWQLTYHFPVAMAALLCPPSVTDTWVDWLRVCHQRCFRLAAGPSPLLWLVEPYARQLRCYIVIFLSFISDLKTFLIFFFTGHCLSYYLLICVYI